MAGYTDAGVYGEDPLQAFGPLGGAVSDDDHARVQGVADAHAPAVVE